tara:strand:- start:153 stop:431 length:279 start_codon:yes stop_codon:yes gene_type:complete
MDGFPLPRTGVFERGMAPKVQIVQRENVNMCAIYPYSYLEKPSKDTKPDYLYPCTGSMESNDFKIYGLPGTLGNVQCSSDPIGSTPKCEKIE